MICRCRKYLPLAAVIALLGIPAASQESNPYCQALVTGAEHGEELSRACDFALSLSTKLPNFICKANMKRFVNPSGNAHVLADTVTATITHDSSGQHEADVEVDGHAADANRVRISGAYSEREFAGDLKAVFNPRSLAQFSFVKQTTVRSAPGLEYHFRIAKDDNRAWSMMFADQVVFPGLKGKLWLSAGTGQVMRLEIESFDVPADFPMLRISAEIDYAVTRLGDGTDFVLPTDIRTTFCTDSIEHCFLNQTTFRNCQKFAAKSRIVTNEGR